MENIDNTQNNENEEDENYEYEFNFINMPWDDRSKKSKIGIIVLLVSIFMAIMAGLLNSFLLYYKGFESVLTYNKSTHVSNCQVLKMDQYSFAVGIDAIDTQGLLCVGALLSDSSVLANGACVKPGPVRLYLGNINEPRCKNGFSADVNVPIYHEGLSKNMAILSSQERLTVCGKPISIGSKVYWKKRADVIGRTFHGGRSLSRQPVGLAGRNCSCTGGLQNKNQNNSIICVKKKLLGCPVFFGDLLVQKGHLLGFSLTSAYRSTENQTHCFADLSAIAKDLKELGVVR